MNTLSKIILIVSFLLTASVCFGQDNSDLQRGIAMYRQGIYDQAIRTLEGLSKIKNYKDAGTVQNYLGLAYLEKNDLKKARKALAKAVELNPQNAVFRANLAFAYLRSNMLNNAQDEAGKAIQIDSKLYTAYLVRGTAFLREGDFDEALADADRTIAANADFPPAYTLKAETLVARFGKRISSGSTVKTELELLGKAVEVLEACVKNCKNSADLTSVNEKLESFKVFYDYFKRDDDTATAQTLSPDDTSTRLKINYKPRAAYTDEARNALVSGKIVIAALFAANGQVTHTIVLKPLGYGLDQEAVKAARGIRFAPFVKDGKPVSVVKMVEYSFQIY